MAPLVPIGAWLAANAGAVSAGASVVGTAASVIAAHNARPRLPQPPPPPNTNQAQQLAQQQDDILRRRRGVLANIYGGGFGAGNAAPGMPAVGRTTLG